MSLEQKWPVPLSDLINFIAFLSKNEYSPSTVKSYISGLSFRVKISGLLDTTNYSFIITKILLGMQRLHKRVDSRRPITIDLLVHIFDTLQHTCSSVYETALFSSCFSLAFFAFLQVDEFAESHLSERHMLQYSDISIDRENGLINLSLPSSKTDQLAIRTNLRTSRFVLYTYY
jgi:hypothetical protein